MQQPQAPAQPFALRPAATAPSFVNSRGPQQQQQQPPAKPAAPPSTDLSGAALSAALAGSDLSFVPSTTSRMTREDEVAAFAAPAFALGKVPENIGVLLPS